MKLGLKLILFIIPSIWLSISNAWQSNFLVGASGGFAQSTGHVDFGMTYLGLPIYPRFDTEIELVDQGGLASVFVGYQWICNRWIYGLELKLDWMEDARAHEYALSDNGFFPGVGILLGFTGQFEYERSPLVGLSARLGYEVSPIFIPYIRFGVEATRDKFNVTVQGLSQIYPFGISLEDKRDIYSYYIGFGAQTPLFSSPFSLRFEYNYIARGRALITSGNIVDGDVNPFFEIQTHSKIHQLFASLVWDIN